MSESVPKHIADAFLKPQGLRGKLSQELWEFERSGEPGKLIPDAEVKKYKMNISRNFPNLQIERMDGKYYLFNHEAAKRKFEPNPTPLENAD